MGFCSSRSARIWDDIELSSSPTTTSIGATKQKYNSSGILSQVSSPTMKPRSSLASKVNSTVFSEDYDRRKRKILDPRGKVIRQWNSIFLVACIVSLFVDPLFFYLQLVWEDQCINIGIPLEVTLTIVRSITDIFYMIQIFIKFRTAYVAPSSRVFGRGELVIGSSKITARYLRTGFFIDLIAALPLPQLLIWIIIPNLKGSSITNTKNVLRFIIIFQYLPRLFLIYPLSSQIIKAHGVVTETAWAGAAYNLTLYMLASHVLGACWYLLSIERQEACWRSVCDHYKPTCEYSFFDCQSLDNPRRAAWLQLSNVSSLCSPTNKYYQFGIYGDALNQDVTSSSFFHKYFYCLWWGLKNLSSLGQSLYTSTFVGEISFAIIIAILGLVLFALLIGNMQRYLQSTTLRLEEWRIKRNDIEQWMHHRQLPLELREAVRRYDQYKWVATRGVDEESLLRGLPMELRRDVKRHLCFDLVRRVPLFEQMDERMLDAICERLKPALCTERTILVREGDPVNEMLFIIRGHLDSYTTNGGRTGFFNSSRIGPGEFCGEELLTWALEGPHPSVIFPSSTRTVKAITEVEAFALKADDLKFVAAQFRKLHSKKIRYKLRFYSHQWRTWAACFIQVAWRRHKHRQAIAELKEKESSGFNHEAQHSIGSSASIKRVYGHSGVN
ncbi:protein CNGC15b-like isoform X2 [Punica granatum]|uniref:Protein CNGC15b-like isoform X2 n=1 Tax=Punica granatum TaxID=22663 RepID=A0A6P8E893_PUNGR|nr:protein CNGC15b-like isoform X2 [Punica granatum]